MSRAALIDGGADIEIPDGSIGTPLDNAIGYACWNVARLLVTCGVKVDKLWHAAALGLLPAMRSWQKKSLRAGESQGVLARLRWRPATGG